MMLFNMMQYNIFMRNAIELLIFNTEHQDKFNTRHQNTLLLETETKHIGLDKCTLIFETSKKESKPLGRLINCYFVPKTEASLSTSGMRCVYKKRPVEILCVVYLISFCVGARSNNHTRTPAKPNNKQLKPRCKIHVHIFFFHHAFKTREK